MSIDIPSKNILVLGNGFDLHHNLKTKYSDYIEFMTQLKKRNEMCANSNKNGVMSLDDLKEDKSKLRSQCLQTYIDKGFSEKTIIKVWTMTNNNFVQYFMSYDAEVKGWIDFEVLIKNITTDIEKVMNRIDDMNAKGEDKHKYGIIGNVREILLARSFSKIFEIDEGNGIYIKKELANDLVGINRKAVIKILRKEFDDLCDSLWLYLKDIEPHYREIKPEFTYQQIENIGADAVITFNYTDTYKRYGISSENAIHVHGSLEENNIVLGFDDDDEKELQYVYFKKYMQCILKRTPILDQYNFSVEVLGEGGINTYDYENPIMHFFGHSLDATDREKLIYLFNIASRIKIYYYDEDDHEEKIEKVIELLGKQNALIGMHDKRIDFIQIEKTEKEMIDEKRERERPFINMFNIYEEMNREKEEDQKKKEEMENIFKQLPKDFFHVLEDSVEKWAILSNFVIVS